jgi:hypothetical protein
MLSTSAAGFPRWGCGWKCARWTATSRVRWAKPERPALLHAGDYFRASGQVTAAPAFQEIVVLRFTVLDAAEHYHLPVKITPWGLSVWRGA